MKKVLLKIKKKLPVMFALMLAVMCMVAPAFAAAPAAVPVDAVVIFEGTAVYFEEDGMALFDDYNNEFCDLFDLGTTYLVSIDGVTYEAVYSGTEDEGCFQCGPYEIRNDHDFWLHMNGPLSEGDSVYVVISTVPTYSDRLNGILNDSGNVVTSLVSWVGSVAKMVINEPIMLIGFTIALATLAFGIFKGLKR